MRGEYREAREIAETFLREAGADARGAEAGDRASNARLGPPLSGQLEGSAKPSSSEKRRSFSWAQLVM